METFLIRLLGFILIWAAVYVGRKKEGDSTIKLISWQFLLQVVLIGIGVAILEHNPS